MQKSKSRKSISSATADSAVQIFVRFRPPKDNLSESRAIHRINMDRIRIDGSEKSSDAATPMRRISQPSPVKYGGLFQFNRVFGPSSTADDVYSSTAKSLVDNMMDGFNATVIAYGQTGSGKTSTMMGLDALENRGVIPRALEEIFQRVDERKKDGWSAKVRISNVQIYMEKVLDLLKPSDDGEAGLQVRQRVEPDGTEEIYVDGATWKDVRTPTQAMRWFKEGNENRVVASTDMNAVSSRSHSVFILKLEQMHVESATHIVSQIYLVDLAGSEMARRTKAEGLVLQQACHVNKSLTILSNVISALAEKRPHVPYRDSKLTRLLTHALGGNSRTSIILTCSPTDDDLPETLSTLQFGQRAQNMQNKPRVNRMLTIEDYKLLLEKAEETMKKQKLVIAALEREVETLRNGKAASPAKAASTITFVEDVKHVIEDVKHVTEDEESEITSGDDQVQAPRAAPVNPVDRLQRLKNHIRKSMTLAPAAARELAELSEQVERKEAPKESMDLPDIGTPLQVSSASSSESSSDEEDPAAVLLPPISKSTGRKRVGTGMRGKYFTPRTVAALSNEMVQHLQEENKVLQEKLDELARMTHETEEAGEDRAITDSISNTVDSSVDTNNTSNTSITSSITPSTLAPAKSSSSVTTNDIVMIVVGSVVLFAALLILWVLQTRFSIPVSPYVWAVLAGASAGSLVLGWGIPNV